MTQNFEQQLKTALKEVIESIDPNYTFDEERNCYVAHDSERNNEEILFSYEKPFKDVFGYRATDISVTTNTFDKIFTLAEIDTFRALKEIITNETNALRDLDEIYQLIESNRFPTQDVQISAKPSFHPDFERERPCIYLDVTTNDDTSSASYYLYPENNHIYLMENDYGYPIARTFDIAEHGNSIPETVNYLVSELNEDLPSIAPQHLSKTEPFFTNKTTETKNRFSNTPPIDELDSDDMELPF